MVFKIPFPKLTKGWAMANLFITERWLREIRKEAHIFQGLVENLHSISLPNKHQHITVAIRIYINSSRWRKGKRWFSPQKGVEYNWHIRGCRKRAPLHPIKSIPLLITVYYCWPALLTHKSTNEVKKKVELKYMVNHNAFTTIINLPKFACRFPILKSETNRVSEGNSSTKIFIYNCTRRCLLYY